MTQVTVETNWQDERPQTEIAQDAGVYTWGVIALAENGIDPSAVEQLIRQAPQIFQHEQRRAHAIDLLTELQRLAGLPTKPTAEDLALLADQARVDYDAAAKIIGSLTPQPIWDEQVAPKLSELNLPAIRPTLLFSPSS